MKKKIFSVFLLCALIGSMIPISILAESTPQQKTTTFANANSTEVYIPDANLKATLNKQLGRETDLAHPITQAEMESLKYISCFVNGVTDFTGLEKAINLERFSVVDNQYITNLDFLKSCTKLKQITLSSCPNLNDISAVSNFPNLTILDISYSINLADISPLYGKKLTKLNLDNIKFSSSNRESNKQVIRSLTNLETLQMPYCDLKDEDLDMLLPLTKLKTLVLNCNDLTNINFVDYLPSTLKEISVYGNSSIKDMSKITKFKNLETLGFGSTQVTDFSFVNQLPYIDNDGIRHGEGTANSPATFDYYVSGSLNQKIETDINNEIKFENPFKDNNGNPISFKNPKIHTSFGNDIVNSYSYDEKTNMITIKVKEKSSGSIDLTVDNYHLPLLKGIDKICKLRIHVNYRTPKHEYTSEITKKPTCTEKGEKTYTCSKCGNSYTEPIDALGHNWSKPVWTWSNDYKAIATFTCKNNDSHKETPEVSVTSRITTSPTCAADGVRTYTATVRFNKKTYEDTRTETIPATGHDWNKPTWTWSDDLQNATATFTCSRNNEHKVTPEVTITSKITTQPTCKNKGIKTYTATVTFNGKTYTSTKTKTIPALSHSASDEWKYDKINHWHECKECGEKIDVTKHNYETTIVSPTCDTTGSITYTCKECGYSYTETIPALGHKWDAPTWNWSDDPIIAYANFICLNSNGTHISTELADLTITIVEPTCTTEGKTIYTAKVEKDGVIYTDTKEVITSPALDHSFGNEWKNDETNHWHECECGEIKDKAEHNFEWVVDKEATEKEDGSKHLECKECGYKKEAVAIPAIKPTENAKSDTVQTGDNSSIEFYYLLMIFASLGLLGIVKHSKKQHN